MFTIRARCCWGFPVSIVWDSWQRENSWIPGQHLVSGINEGAQPSLIPETRILGKPVVHFWAKLSPLTLMEEQLCASNDSYPHCNGAKLVTFRESNWAEGSLSKPSQSAVIFVVYFKGRAGVESQSNRSFQEFELSFSWQCCLRLKVATCGHNG